MKMKIWLLSLLTTLSLVAIGRAQAPEAEAATETGRTVALVAIGEVDTSLVERVRAWVEHVTALPVHVLAAREAQADTLYDEALLAAESMEADDVCLVGLVGSGHSAEDHTVSVYEKNVSVINLQVLKPDPEDAELFGRRVERLAVRSYGFLLGAQPVPIMESALFPYKDLAGLDQMGRGLDPPSMGAVQKAAAERGVKLDEDNPFYIR